MQLQSCGIELKVQITPKEISFGKILLNNVGKRTLNITNKTEHSIFWKLLTESSESPIAFSFNQGKLSFNENLNIECQYYANIVRFI